MTRKQWIFNLERKVTILDPVHGAAEATCEIVAALRPKSKKKDCKVVMEGLVFRFTTAHELGTRAFMDKLRFEAQRAYNLDAFSGSQSYPETKKVGHNG